MGNCCSNQSGHEDQNLTIKEEPYVNDGTNFINAKVKAGYENVPNEPKPDICQKVDKMNEPSKDAGEWLKGLGPIDQPAGGPDLSHLPKLGPYKYKDGTTYEG